MTEHKYTIQVDNDADEWGEYTATVYQDDKYVAQFSKPDRDEAITRARQHAEWHRTADHSKQVIEL